MVSLQSPTWSKNGLKYSVTECFWKCQKHSVLIFEIAPIVGNSQWFFCMIINVPEPYQFRISTCMYRSDSQPDLVRMLLR